jgi:hypothetical protein
MERIYSRLMYRYNSNNRLIWLPYCISCYAQPWRIYKHAIRGHLRVVERFNLFFLTNSRLATYAKHAKVTHAINDITSCHDYKVVDIIQESSYQPYTSSHAYVWCSENKLHPYPWVSRRFKSIITLQGKITWQHVTCEPQRQHKWPPLVMTIKELGLGPTSP